VRAHIGFIKRYLQRLQCAGQLVEIAKPAGIHAKHGLLLKGLQPQFFHLQALQACQWGLHRRPVAGRQKGDRGLLGQQHLLGPLSGGQPVFDLGAVRKIAPMAREDKAREFGGCEG